MKKIIYTSVLTVCATLFATSCQDNFLDKNPLGVETDVSYFNDESNALLAINGIYDVLSWDEGPGNFGVYVPHNYEFFYGDILSGDAAKGSEPGDFVDLKLMEEWQITPTFGPVYGTWANNFTGIARANTAIARLPQSTIGEELKSRLLGEAYFLRAYFYFYNLRIFGGLPLFSEPIKPSEFGKVQRSSIAEVYQLIEADLAKAIELLPEKSEYAAADLGRATKGSAHAYLARVIMYQLGTDNSNGHSWAEVKAQTQAVIESGQYALQPNFAVIFEDEGENGPESIFEVQNLMTSQTWGSIKTGTTGNIFQNNRDDWGWGFNNPTENLVDEFEEGDPRLPCTAYANGEIVLGKVQTVTFPAKNETGFLNRKAAILKPDFDKASGQNYRKMRYADVLLMHAEAAFYTNDESTARQMLNLIRTRARQSGYPKGSVEGSLTYEMYAPGENDDVLPPILASVTGNALRDAIRHERRVELAMESLRFWDEVRYGTFIPSLPAAVQSRVTSRAIEGSVNLIPVLPIPADEVQSWGLEQNPGYN